MEWYGFRLIWDHWLDRIILIVDLGFKQPGWKLKVHLGGVAKRMENFPSSKIDHGCVEDVIYVMGELDDRHCRLAGQPPIIIASYLQ